MEGRAAMTIEIYQPELEALIQRRMASGKFKSVEDVLMHALKASPDSDMPPTDRPRKQSFTQFLIESPLAGSGLEFERIRDYPRPVEF
jgi:hypothetical protein